MLDEFDQLGPMPIVEQALKQFPEIDSLVANVGTQDGRNAAEVKISRTSVMWTMTLTSIGIPSNTWLRFLFKRTASGLPQIATQPAQAPLEA